MSKSAQAFSRKFETFGIKCLYIALAIVFIWIGVMKFTAYEANGIAPLVSNNLF